MEKVFEESVVSSLSISEQKLMNKILDVTDPQLYTICDTVFLQVLNLIVCSFNLFRLKEL